MNFNLRSIPFIALIIFLYYDLKASPVEPRPIAVIHFEQIDHLIYIPITINGSTPQRFILDSGASVWVIDPSQVSELGLKTQGNGIIHGAGSGSVDVTYADSISFGLAGIKNIVPKTTIIDISNAVPGQKIGGLIGYDFFERYVVEIDYHTNTIRLFDPKDFIYKGKGTIVPITIKKKQIYIRAKIKVVGQEAIENEYLVDSGSADEINDELISKVAKTTADGGVGIGKGFKVALGNIETFTIGNITLKNIPGVSGGQKIGAGLLHNYTVIFDYTHKQMILE